MPRTPLYVPFGVIALLALPGLCRPAHAQGGLDTVTIRTQRVAEGVYMLMGAGGNIGVSVGADAVFLVDDQFAPLTPKIAAAVAAISSKPVRFVVNTHWHWDHTGGNENMGRVGALLVAHENVRRRMSTRQFVEFVKREQLPSPAGALPVITFTEAVTFHINGDDVSAIHVPHAHTDGDAIVRFQKANVVHMGDVYVTYGYPFIDLSSGGSVNGLLDAVDRILATINDSTKVIPGHGALSNRAGLTTYRGMVGTVRDRVQRLKADGKSLQDAIAARPTAEFDATWGNGFVKPDQFVEMVYTSLPKE
jgi:cyclase